MGLVAAVFMLLAIAAPVGAATTGQVCGEVEAYTAPTLLADGSVTINGTAETVLFAAVDAATSAQLAALAALGAFTCVDITADGGGDITALSVAAQAQLCGTVTESAGVFLVNDTALTADALALVAGDATLSALLNAAADGGANVCLDLALDSAGVVSSINLDATLALCGSATLDADSATIGGVDVPTSLLSAEAAAALQVAADAGLNACVDVTVANTSVVDAAVDVSVDLCGTVTLNADGSATVDGVNIPADLIDADLAAALDAAARAGGEACISVSAVSSGGETIVTVIADISLCATVEAITATTITVGGVTFPTDTDLTADVQVGDDICLGLVTGPSGEIVVPGGTVTLPDGTPIGGDGTPTTGGGGTPAGEGTELLPDTASAAADAASRATALAILGLMAAVTLVLGTRLVRERLERLER